MGMITDIIGNLFSDGKGPASTIVETICKQFPGKMSDAEKLQFELLAKSQDSQYHLEMTKQAMEADQQFNERLKAMEGTASDLIQFGFFGRVILFMRGAQRPLWGFAAMGIDLMVFSGQWHLENNADKNLFSQEGAFWLINMLVLGFLFGERMLMNILPLMTKYMSEKNK